MGVGWSGEMGPATRCDVSACSSHGFVCGVKSFKIVSGVDTLRFSNDSATALSSRAADVEAIEDSDRRIHVSERSSHFGPKYRMM
jgi:hypothetical protein